MFELYKFRVERQGLKYIGTVRLVPIKVRHHIPKSQEEKHPRDPQSHSHTQNHLCHDQRLAINIPGGIKLPQFEHTGH